MCEVTQKIAIFMILTLPICELGMFLCLFLNVLQKFYSVHIGLEHFLSSLFPGTLPFLILLL